MSTILQLGHSPVRAKDDEFGNGFQVGYLHFKKDFQGQPITDELIYTIIAQTAVNVTHTGRCNAGYLIGFIAALLERQPPLKCSFIHVQSQGASPINNESEQATTSTDTIKGGHF